jgi:phage-related protein
MIENLDFYYDGISSIDMGLINVQTDSGLFKEQLLPNRNIEEVKIRGNDKPYFQDLTFEPLEFSLTFGFSESFDTDKLRSVARWLNQDYYKPFYFSDRIDRIFYCMPVGETMLNHNGLGEGYVTLKMRCDGAYSYTNMFETPTYNSTSTTTYTDIVFDNIGDTIVYPTLFIEKVGTGDVEIFNTTTGETMLITGLADGENLVVDSEKESITTDIPMTYRYSNFNDNYIYLTTGTNNLRLKGVYNLYIRYYFKILG